jgi:uncharacterized protein (DUF486 family)
MKKITSFALFAVALAIYSFAFALDQQPAAKTEHVMFAAADLKWNDGILQVHAMGPFEVKYVNPSDDPRNAKK